MKVLHDFVRTDQPGDVLPGALAPACSQNGAHGRTPLAAVEAPTAVDGIPGTQRLRLAPQVGRSGAPRAGVPPATRGVR